MKMRMQLVGILALFVLMAAVIPAGATEIGPCGQGPINQAINTAAIGATTSNPGIVTLGSGVFEITAPIILKSNIILQGAGDDTVIYATYDICDTWGEPSYIFGEEISNAVVSNMAFESDAEWVSDGGTADYRQCIEFVDCYDCEVHDVSFLRYLYHDGVKVVGGSGVEVYNCVIKSAGHDGVCFYNTEDCRMYNCDVEVQVNTGVRVDGCEDIQVDHNTFTGTPGVSTGWCCVEIENGQVNTIVTKNIMHDFYGSSSSAGIGDWNSYGSVNVFDNVMWNLNPYVQVGIGENIISPSNTDVGYWNGQGYGYISGGEDPVEDPVEDPIEDPVEDPVEDPIEDPVEDPVVDEDESIIDILRDIRDLLREIRDNQ